MKNELIILEMKKQLLHKQIVKIEKQINELRGVNNDQVIGIQITIS